MTSTTSTTLRRRRLAATVLALPLALAMTGTAFAAGSSTAELRTASAGSAGQGPDQASADTSTTGSAAGAASGRSAATATQTNTAYVNGNANSSKADRPNAPVTQSAAPSQPISNADASGKGANPGSATQCATSNPYCSNNTGVEPGNGNDSAPAQGQPCAGCVGKADNKNPAGQAPGGSDLNAGYECDRNQGVGKMNPAHTGCTTSTPTTPPTTGGGTVDACPNMAGNQPAGTKCDGGSQAGKTAGNGTATINVAVSCRTVSVVSSKDISNVVVRFVDGTSVKFDGLSGKTWTRTFAKDVRSATAKSATTSVTGTSTGCSGTAPGAPPAQTCSDGSALPATGAKDCPKPPKTCSDGSALPATGPQDCPKGGVAAGNATITICHATGSATNPYVTLTVDRSALNGHGDHARDLIPMPAGGCPTAPATVTDACPNLGGIQMPGTSCTPPAGGSGGGPVDVCPDVPGMQSMAPCTVNGGGTPIGGVTPGEPATRPTVPGGTAPGASAPGATTPGATPPGATAPGALNPPAAGTPFGGVTPGLPATKPTGMGPATVTGTVTAPAVIGGVSAPAAAARPSALPFTGTDAALLVELGALLLLAGGGVLVAARRERTARAA